MTSDENRLPQKRKRTLNSKLTSEDNVHQDAVKHRKLMAQSTSSQLTQPKAKLIPHRSRSASVEVVDDQDNLYRHNAGTPRDPDTLLESVYDDEWETLMERSRNEASASTKGKGKLQDPKANSKSRKQRGHSASVEDVDDQDNFSRRNAGRPRDPNTIIESTDDDEYESPVDHAPKKKATTSRKSSWKAAPKIVDDADGLQEDADEAELG